MESGCGMQDDRNLNGVMRDKITLAGAGFDRFDWRDAGCI